MTDATHNGFDKPPAGWQSLVNEVQARIDAVDTAMANLRIAVRYLTANAEREQITPSAVVETSAAVEALSAFASAPVAEPVAVVQAEPVPAGPTAEQIAAEQEAAREEVRKAVEAARNEMAPAPASSFAWTMPRDVWPGSTPTPATPEPSEDPARDEVRRAVEEARAQMARGELEPAAPTRDLFETIDEPPAAPVISTPAAIEYETPSAIKSTPAPAAYVPAPPASEVPSWTSFVEAPFSSPPAQTVSSAADSYFSTPSNYSDAPRENPSFVPSSVDFSRSEPSEEFADEIDTEEEDEPELDPEAQREAVRQAVERAKFEMQAVSTSQPESNPEDEATAREEVRRAVAQMRNEMNWTSAPHVSFDNPNGLPATNADDPDGKREEVRRVVENARAEMNFGVGGLSMYDETAPREVDGLAPEETQSLFAAFAGAESSATAWHKSESDFTGMPPSIVIEDAEGRVELARVYDTLNRVDRSQAALLNYSPHSVTVGLAAREHLPEPEVMIAAVRDAFGRTCRVSTEGVKMSVKIGEGEKAA